MISSGKQQQPVAIPTQFKLLSFIPGGPLKYKQLWPQVLKHTLNKDSTKTAKHTLNEDFAGFPLQFWP